MQDPINMRPELASRVLGWVPWVLGICLMVTLAVVVYSRLVYPYDLEWMEGGMLAHAWRVQHGLPLYPAPGPDFIPYVYPPGYSVLLAGISWPMGLGYAPARLISVVSTLAAGAAIAWGTHRHTGSHKAGIFAAIAFFGTFRGSGAFFDLVRPDALATALLAWAIVIGLEKRRGADVAAGLLLFASFMVKHNTAALGVPMVVGIFARDGWRNAIRFGLAAAVPAGLCTLYMQGITDGNYLKYLIEVPQSHPKIWARVLPGGPRELGNTLPIVTVLPAIWLVVNLRTWIPRLAAWTVALPVVGGVGFAWYTYTLGGFSPPVYAIPASFGAWGIGASVVVLGLLGMNTVVRRKMPSWRWIYGVGCVLTAVVVAAVMRSHNGGYLNVYMQMHWVICFAFGIVIARLWTSPNPWTSIALSVAVSAQMVWHLGTLEGDRITPTRVDRETGDSFVAAVGEYDRVLSPFAAWIPVQAGGEPSLHLIALWDLNYKGGPFYEDVERVREAIRAHRWDAVVDGSQGFGYGLMKSYKLHKTIHAKGRDFAPKTGWSAKPKRVLIPR